MHLKLSSQDGVMKYIDSHMLYLKSVLKGLHIIEKSLLKLLKET